MKSWLNHPHRALFNTGLILFLALDILFFSNCIIPGNTQSPRILDKGQSDLGISGHTGMLLIPIEAGLFYRYGLGNGGDIGIRAHNWMNLGGALLDIRSAFGNDKYIGSLSAGFYSDSEREYLTYLAPSLMLSYKSVYSGLKLNTLLGNSGVGELGNSEKVSTYFAGGISQFGGFRLGEKWFLAGSYEWGFYGTNHMEAFNGSKFFPIVQLELGLGYTF